MTPEDRAAAKADIANDLKKCYPEAGGALIETVGYGGAPLFMARSKIVAIHGTTEPGCSTVVVDAAVPNDEWRVRELLSSLVAKVGCGHAAPKTEPDPAEMRPMLQAMQSGEMSVSRGIELLNMWLAGNYSDDQLPPVRNELGEGEMPWDRIDVLTKKCALYEQALKASWPAGASGKAFEYWNAARAAK